MMETVLDIGLNDASVARAGRAQRRRAVRLGLLPAAGPDVRQDRAGRDARAVRRRARPGQGAAGRRARRRPDGERPARTSSRRTRSHRRRDAGRDSRRTRTSSSPARSGRSSSPGTPSAPCLPPPGADPDDLGTAVNVHGHGVRQPRRRLRHRGVLHPRPGHRRTRASTATTCQRPGRGRRRRHPQHGAAGRSRASSTRRYDAAAIMATLEHHYRDLCDIEFTIERGQLWMLQTRVGKRTAGGGVPDRLAPRRRGRDRPRRGTAPGHRRPARAADVPRVRPDAPTRRC